MQSLGQRRNFSSALTLVSVCILVLLGAAWAVFLISGARLSDAEWAKFLPGFTDADTAFGPTPAGHIPRIVAINLALWTALIGFAFLVARFKERLQQPEVRIRLV
jgi:hypothetical protein